MFEGGWWIVGLASLSTAVPNATSEIVAAEPAVDIIESHEFDVRSDRAVFAELISRPIGMSDDAFARALVDASGVDSWNGSPLYFAAAPGRMGVHAATSSTGPEVSVYFSSGNGQRTGKVCRLRRERGGMTRAWTDAQDWCASKLGLPPIKRYPPAGTSSKPPSS